MFRKGIDVLHVTHLGRQVTAAQRTALEARGAACECCGSRYLLDIDHNEGWTLTHDTKVEDLSWLCWRCHEEKTRHDLRLEGPPNQRYLVHRKTGERWRPPPGGHPNDEVGVDPSIDRPGGPAQPELFTLAD